MDSPATSRLRAWAGDVRFAWQERVWHPLRGYRPCPIVDALLTDPALEGRPVRQELQQIVGTIVGRRLGRHVVGDHRSIQSLTDFLERGKAQAAQLLPHVAPHEAVLEYGGGIGRLGRAVRPHVRRLVSVDVDPLMKVYGPRVSPDVEFLGLGDLPESPDFDGAYSVAVFFHLSPDLQRRAIEYVHRRLKPGGWFLVDLKIGPRTAASAPGYGPVRTTALEDFQALYEPLFTATRVPLFNAGFLLRKQGEAPVPAVAIEGRYGVNDASIVFDVLEGQVVVVNLDSGSYYILEGTASTIWQMLAAGLPVAGIAATLARRHDADAASVEATVTDFVAQLTGELLLAPVHGHAPPAFAFDERQLGDDRRPFTAPVMYRYTDMQALIQMDPIRDYDETGWPKRPAAEPPNAP